jgi:hypothetical protein
MPHAIFFMKDGHAIHGSYEVKHLGKPASHGCVRISPQNAATLYSLVAKAGLKNTQVVLAGDAPGAGVKVASKSRSGVNTRHSFKPRFDYYAEASPPPQRRGGFSVACLVVPNSASARVVLRRDLPPICIPEDGAFEGAAKWSQSCQNEPYEGRSMN